ncbi:hypothetical protein EBV26_21115 [bacterium]|nr:hypothetical protein [bacterium]
MAINSNSFITIGSSNPTNRVTMRAEDQSIYGPHVVIYTNADENYPLYQHLNWTHDHITHSYDSYWQSNSWWASSSNAFQTQKTDGRFMIKSACNLIPGQNIDSLWRTAFTSPHLYSTLPLIRYGIK